MLRDLRHAWRLMLRSKGFTAIAVFTLALGIGAATAVFSIVNGTLLRPLPYREPARLVEILDQGLHERGLIKLFASYTDFRAYAQQARAFDGLAAVTWAVKSPILSGRGDARNVTAIAVSAGFFDLLGAQAAMGRTFVAGDESGGCSAVLSHAFWTSAFGADARIVGQTVDLDDQPCAILGVMPPGFSFYPTATQMWTLITRDRPKLDKLLVVGVGRLKPGVTAGQAQDELAAIHAAAHTADSERSFGPAVNSLQQEFTWLAGRNLRTTLWILLAAVALVLAIACVNVANLLLGRSLLRSREFAVRVALGGGRLRLFRQLLTEGLLLSAMGGVLGVWLAYAAVSGFRSANPVELPPGAVVAIDPVVLVFALALCVLTALLFSAAPAWRAFRADWNTALKNGGRGSVRGGSRLGRTMAAVEMALSVILMCGAGLLVESVLRMGSADLGIRPEGLTAANVLLPESHYREAAATRRFSEAFQRRIAALPGVEAAAVTSTVPPQGTGSDTLELFGQPKPAGQLPHDTVLQWIGADYFKAMGTAILAGRGFTAHDDDGEPVAVIDESLARLRFPAGDALGSRIRVGGERNPWMTVVGIAAAERRTTVYQEMQWVAQPSVFRPFAQNPVSPFWIAVRTRGEGIAMATGLRREAAAIDPAVAVAKIQGMRQMLGTYLTNPRFRAMIFGGFAVLALLLAAIGLHGVLSELVSQRTQEIGVRMALGARPADIARLVAWQAGGPVVAGLAAGVAGILALGRYLSSMLYGVQAKDPVTLACAGLALFAAAAVALARPARRAVRTDPMVALRQE